MCLGIPGRVVERNPQPEVLEWALVEFGGTRRKVCVSCVPECKPGDYVLVHAGIAITIIDPAEAERVAEFVDAAGDRDGWDDLNPSDPGSP